MLGRAALPWRGMRVFPTGVVARSPPPKPGRGPAGGWVAYGRLEASFPRVVPSAYLDADMVHAALLCCATQLARSRVTSVSDATAPKLVLTSRCPIDTN